MLKGVKAFWRLSRSTLFTVEKSEIIEITQCIYSQRISEFVAPNIQSHCKGIVGFYQVFERMRKKFLCLFLNMSDSLCIYF